MCTKFKINYYTFSDYVASGFDVTKCNKILTTIEPKEFEIIKSPSNRFCLKFFVGDAVFACSDFGNKHSNRLLRYICNDVNNWACGLKEKDLSFLDFYKHDEDD